MALEGGLRRGGLRPRLRRTASPGPGGSVGQRSRRCDDQPARQPAQPVRRAGGRPAGRRRRQAREGRGDHRDAGRPARHQARGTPRLRGEPGGAGPFVSYPVEREEDIFTVLTDFGDPDQGRHRRHPGPVHNQIPAPDRVWDGNATDDNSTYWTADFNRAHFQDMMFGERESFKDFYLKQSTAASWPRVTSPTGSPCPTTRPATATEQQRRRLLELRQGHRARLVRRPEGGRQDRRGDHDLPQAVRQGRPLRRRPGRQLQRARRLHRPLPGLHAGEGEEAGGGAQGADAIWSHRWYASPPTPARPARGATARRRADRQLRHLGR